MNRFYLNAIIVVSLLGLFSCDKNAEPPKISADISAVESISIQTAVKFVNADTVSRLPIYYKLLDKNGKQVYLLEDKIQLYANGVLQPNNRYFSTGKVQTVNLEARLGDLQSSNYSITSRAPKTYPLIRLPLIFHIPKDVNLDEAGVSLDKVVQQINKIFRNRVDSLNPNVADSYIEFYLAPKDPNGKLLEQPGLHRLDVVSQPIRDSARIIAMDVLHEWCMKNYLNIFFKINLNLISPPIPGHPTNSFVPGIIPDLKNPTCEELNKQLTTDAPIPAINMYDESYFTVLPHEFGHFLNLSHTFATGCSSSPDPIFGNIQDTPRHIESIFQSTNAGDFKSDCEGVPFQSTNVMDYFVTAVSFTQDQVAFMRKTIDHPYYLPIQ